MLLVAWWCVAPPAEMAVLAARGGRFDAAAGHLRRQRDPGNAIMEVVNLALARHATAVVVPLLRERLTAAPGDRAARGALVAALLAQRRLNEAVAALEQAPRRERAQQAELAGLYEQAGRLADALAIYQGFLRGTPRDLPWLRRIARLQAWMLQPEQEAATLEKILALQPDRDTGLRLLDLDLWLGNPDRAAQVADRLLRVPDLPLATLRAIRALRVARRDAPGALAVARRACDQPEAEPADFVAAAQLDLWSGQPASAAAALRNGLARFPGDVGLIRYLASIEHQLKDYAGAADNLARVAAATGQDADWVAAAVMNNDAGRRAAAQAILDRLLAADPPYAPALWLQGLLALQAGRIDLARDMEQRLARWLDSHPADARARQQHTDLRERLASLEPDAAPALASDDPAGRLAQAAQSAAETNDLARAEQLWREYLAQRPDDAWAWWQLADVLDRAGQGSKTELRQALAHAPLDGSAERYAFHARVREKQGRMPEALLYYEAAFRAAPDDVDLACDYANLLRAQGRADLAADLIAPLAAAHPDHARLGELADLVARDRLAPLLELARAAARSNDLARAEQAYRDYLDQQPDDGWAWYELGETLFQARGSGLAEQEKALDRLPLDGTTARYVLHARVLDRAQRVNDAIQLYEKALQVSSNNVEVACDLADLYLRHRYYRQMADLLDEIDRRQPDYLRAQRLRALLWIEQGRYAAAVKLLRRLHAAHGGDYELEGDLAYAEDRNGNWPESIRLYEDAARKSARVRGEEDRTVAFQRRARQLRRQYEPEFLYTHGYQASDQETIQRDWLAAAVYPARALALAPLLLDERYQYEPPGTGTNRTARLTTLSLRGTWQYAEWLQPWLAGWGYRASGDTAWGAGAGVRWLPQNKIDVRLHYRYRQPWNENEPAVEYAGHYQEIYGSVYARAIRRINLGVDAGRRAYTLQAPPPDSSADGGLRTEVGARLEYELLFSPDRSVSEGFRERRGESDDAFNLALLPYLAYRQVRHPVDAAFTAVPVTSQSRNYVVGLDYYRPVNAAWGYHLGAYTGMDPDRDLRFGKVYGVRGKILYIFRERWRVWAEYELISETVSGLNEGRTQYLNAGVNYNL